MLAWQDIYVRNKIGNIGEGMITKIENIFPQSLTNGVQVMEIQDHLNDPDERDFVNVQSCLHTYHAS